MTTHSDTESLLLPEGTRLVHIGPPKTGTTSLQRAFHGGRDAVRAAGRPLRRSDPSAGRTDPGRHRPDQPDQRQAAVALDVAPAGQRGPPGERAAGRPEQRVPRGRAARRDPDDRRRPRRGAGPRRRSPSGRWRASSPRNGSSSSRAGCARSLRRLARGHVQRGRRRIRRRRSGFATTTTSWSPAGPTSSARTT